MLQFWIAVAVLILAGALAAAPLIAGKNPSLGKMIDQLKPFEAILGIVALAIAIWGLINIIPNIGALFSSLRGIAGILGTLALLGVGFLLSFPMIGSALGPTGANLAKSLTPFKGLMGLVCVGLGIFSAVTYFV